MDQENRYRFEPDYAVAPGETLKEVIESLEMTQKELAVRTELTVQTVNRIIKGEHPVSFDTASRLELATGVPARMWNNLEMQYQEQLARIREKQRLAEDLEWLKSIPTRELVNRGYLVAQTDRTLLLRDTLKFFGVSSVQAWRSVWESPAVAARRSSCFESAPGPASVWLRMGELQAHKVECASVDRELFKKNLKKIKILTNETPGIFLPRLKELCAESGVALVLVPRVDKVPWYGATKWITSEKVMILLNLRGKKEDQFWFSFFHEAGHVLHDKKKDIYINDGNAQDPREKKADEFASEFLIPRRYNKRIENIKTGDEILGLAEETGVSPGIVVGRYHYLTSRWKSFNKYNRKFVWNSER